jgi:hypothetical protein
MYFRVYEPNLVRERKEGRLKRRRFWAAGVNDMLAVDQHDKWKRFGLALHTGISDVTARARPGYRGLGSAFAAQGFTNHKPKPWAKLRHGLGSASA